MTTSSPTRRLPSHIFRRPAKRIRAAAATAATRPLFVCPRTSSVISPTRSGVEWRGLSFYASDQHTHCSTTAPPKSSQKVETVVPIQSGQPTPDVRSTKFGQKAKGTGEKGANPQEHKYVPETDSRSFLDRIMRTAMDSTTITVHTFRSLLLSYSLIGHDFRRRFLSLVYGVEHSRVLYVILTTPFGQYQTGSPTKARELCPYVVSVVMNPTERGKVLHRASCSTVPKKRYARKHTHALVCYSNR